MGNDSAQKRLTPLVKRVTDGEGLDVPAVKAILREELDDLELDYEVDKAVRWLDIALGPTDLPQPPETPEELPPLPEDVRFAGDRAGLPAANDIYRAVGEKRVTPELATQLAGLVPYLTRAQVAWLLKHRRQDWGGLGARLRYAAEVKRRVAAIASAYGGFQHAPQASTIAAFLGEAAGLGLWEQRREGRRAPFAALGPEEVAVLLQAGLATGQQGRQTQINNRLLIELMRRRPDAFALEVLIEMGHQSPRALSAGLFAFLDQDQHQMRDPVDLARFLERKLGLTVPRQADYMAGGVKARQCYTEALDDLAREILARGDGYLSRKAHLQVARYQPVKSGAGRAHPTLVKHAQAAVAEADRRGKRCQFDRGGRGALREEAAAAYRASFAACAELLAEEPLAYRRPWLRAFWARNEEALRVLSVVRNYQDDTDTVRRWLHTRLALQGRPQEKQLRNEQKLLEAVVNVLYLHPRDRDKVRRDPLVRIVVDPEPGHYDFTVVSAMGVITEGARGRELEDTYRRLTERRGVRVLRADTGTGRSLEYNARRVIDEIKRVETPWGYVGYSQGCANGLMAESRLTGGTPDEQKLVAHLVTRNLLFSATNGSAHGTSGDEKVARLLIAGERALKPYQATFSAPAIHTFFRAARAALDSRAFVTYMAGWHSLTYERARSFHRDLQVVETAITSTTRGACDVLNTPEALEYMYHLLGRLRPGADHDTQVTLEEAQGHALRVKNAWTEALARCSTGSLPQNIHHWSPLSPDAEVSFVTTERDHERAVYESPKDRHIFPWLDVNARFGRIRMS